MENTTELEITPSNFGFELLEEDGEVMFQASRAEFKTSVLKTPKGVENGKVANEFKLKWSQAEADAGKCPKRTVVNAQGERETKLVREVVLKFVDEDVARNRQKRDDKFYRQLSATLRKLTGLTTKNTKGEPIVIKEGEAITLNELRAWVNGQGRIHCTGKSFEGLPEETKDKVLKVVGELDAKVNSLPKLNAEQKNKAYSELLRRAAAAGLIKDEKEFLATVELPVVKAKVAKVA